MVTRGRLLANDTVFHARSRMDIIRIVFGDAVVGTADHIELVWRCQQDINTNHGNTQITPHQATTFFS